MDMDDLLRNWLAVFDRLTEEDKARLRLRPVFFLSPG